MKEQVTIVGFSHEQDSLGGTLAAGSEGGSSGVLNLGSLFVSLCVVDTDDFWFCFPFSASCPGHSEPRILHANPKHRRTEDPSRVSTHR